MAPGWASRRGQRSGRGRLQAANPRIRFVPEEVEHEKACILTGAEVRQWSEAVGGQRGAPRQARHVEGGQGPASTREEPEAGHRHWSVRSPKKGGQGAPTSQGARALMRP